ncbi:MAG: phenylalanine--tRNA ligase subunit beta [Clostridiales bacterium]|jgi:phenylalanyl-tRNA synthetase beta chain|nr:phenylalanine--tRNA ligase subunit beta [Clostridiales bacterium]
MKLSLNWIKDYVKIPEEMDLSRLAYDLTMSAVEVEGAADLAKKFDGMVIGEIKEISAHPNADKLRICQTDIGGGDIKEIVCGGINLYEGMKALVAKPGASVRWHGEGEPVVLGETKIRGVKSYGMICASSEVGLFDLFPFTDDGTVADLSAFEFPAGTPVADALGLNDIILEIDNKSMTNRPDLWGHYGIAREIAAIYNLPLLSFEPYLPQAETDFDVEIKDTKRCPRYVAARIEGLYVKPSPFEIQSRLWRVGLRPINALVDITNYVMLSVGQPAHAFDSDNIKGHITVRRANEGEKLLLLNDKELSLTSEDLVIADNESAVGLAGVMGGSKDSVLPSTTKVILEIANFEALGIRKTAARFDTRTEAATRFEKAIDPERCDLALSQAMRLFADLYPQMTVTGFRDVYPVPLKKSEIDVSLSWLQKRLGKNIPNNEIAEKLSRLGFETSFNADLMHVVTPTWRSTGDVSIPADIMEEVARMYGFENFEASPITTSFEGAVNQINAELDRKIKEYLAFRCGMREVFTYPWMTDEYVNAVLQNTDGILSLSTPPSPSESYLRASVLPNLCKAVSENLRFFGEFGIFETAQVFGNDFTAEYDKRELLPSERKTVGGALTADFDKTEELFRKAKGILEEMPRYVHMPPFTFEQTEKPVWADNTVWLNIVFEGKKAGNLALLSKKTALDCGIKNSAVMLFEIDIDTLSAYPSRTNTFEHLPEYPVAEYDLSMLFNSAVKWSEIEQVISETDKTKELIQNVIFIDEYRGKQVPDGKKSVTFRLFIGSRQKTLTSGEIEAKANSVVKKLSKVLDAQIRS